MSAEQAVVQMIMAIAFQWPLSFDSGGLVTPQTREGVKYYFFRFSWKIPSGKFFSFSIIYAYVPTTDFVYKSIYSSHCPVVARIAVAPVHE